VSLKTCKEPSLSLSPHQSILEAAPHICKFSFSLPSHLVIIDTLPSVPSARSPLLCTLPPTCHLPNCPMPLSDSHAFEAHYATHHARVCSSSGCGCVFPDARLLELVRPCLRPDLFHFITHYDQCCNAAPEIHRECGVRTVCNNLSSSSFPANRHLTPPQIVCHLPSVHARSQIPRQGGCTSLLFKRQRKLTPWTMAHTYHRHREKHRWQMASLLGLQRYIDTVIRQLPIFK
jgi:hypothetical protein